MTFLFEATEMVNYLTRINAAGESQITASGQEDDITFSMWGDAMRGYGSGSPWDWLEQGRRVITTEEILFEMEGFEEYTINAALTWDNANDSNTVLDIVLAFMKRTIDAGHCWRIS